LFFLPEFYPGATAFRLYTDVKLKPIRTYVSLLNLWRALGLEFIVNLDQRWPQLRFTRRFWEHYLSALFAARNYNSSLLPLSRFTNPN
jgi:hypothetical protein